MKKEKIYVAGSLFTDKQIHQRIEEENKLKQVLGEDKISIYNPITNDEINDKTKQPTSRDIFLQDTKKVIESDIITADLDDEDMGVAMELGIAYGINYILDYLDDKINECLEIERVDKAMKLATALGELTLKIPYKTIYATCSDIRQDGKNENGLYKSWGQNQYVVGGIEEMGTIHRHFDDVLQSIKNK